MTQHSSDQHIRPCLLIYDGQCRLCVTAKQGFERLGTNTVGDDVRMITYQSEEAKDILGPRYRPGRPDVAYLIGSDGDIVQGLDAFLPLLPGLKGGRLLMGLFRIPLIKPLGRLLYRFVARYRYRLFGEVPLEGHQGLAGDRSNRSTKSP
ncbi:thiol-disulfide oxidoreductase DCC family protein [Petrachloros mirabilis]